MGQRLAVSIMLGSQRDGKDPMDAKDVDICIYYHWIGYTTSALEEVTDLNPVFLKWEQLNIKDPDEARNKLYELLCEHLKGSKGVPHISKDSIKSALTCTDCPIDCHISVFLGDKTVGVTGAFSPFCEELYAENNDGKTQPDESEVSNLNDYNLSAVIFNDLPLLLDELNHTGRFVRVCGSLLEKIE